MWWGRFVVKTSSSSFLCRNEVPEILMRTQTSFSQGTKKKQKCPQAAGLNEQLVSVPADVSVRGCVRDAGVWLQVFSTSGFFSVHFSLHRSLCFSPPNLSRTHSFTFNVLPSCGPAWVLFPAYSVMSPAFPSMASLCLFLWYSWVLSLEIFCLTHVLFGEQQNI